MHLSAPNPPSAAKRKWAWCPKHDGQDDLDNSDDDDDYDDQR